MHSFEQSTRDLTSALPEAAFEVWQEVEDRLVMVGERAPTALVRPALEALTSGGKRLRPLLLILSARLGAPDRESLLRVSTAIEVLHTATLIHDDIVDRAESRRGQPTTVAAYGREIAIGTGDYLFAESFSELAGIGTRGSSGLSPRRPKGLRWGNWNSTGPAARRSDWRRIWTT